MSLLQIFNDEDLSFIQDCDDVLLLKDKFINHRSKWKFLVNFNQNFTTHTQNNNNITQALIDAIANAPTYPILMLLTTLELTTVSVLPLSILTLTVAAITLVTGALFFYADYKQLRKKQEDDELNYKLTFLKILAAEEQTQRAVAEINKKISLAKMNDWKKLLSNKNKVNLPHQNQKNSALRRHLQRLTKFQEKLKNILDKPERITPSHDDENRFSLLKDSASAAMLISFTLYTTYFVALNAVMGSFGLSAFVSALTGPIGLVVAFGGSALIGIGFAYKYYQSSKAANEIEKKQNKLTNKLNLKRQKNADISKIADSLHLGLEIHSERVAKPTKLLTLKSGNFSFWKAKNRYRNKTQVAFPQNLRRTRHI